MGILRPMPKARLVTFRRARLVRAVFVKIDPALYPAHRFLVKPAGDDVARAEVSST